MKHEILLVREVALRFRANVSTVNRWLHQRRKGQGNFPLPISPPGGKLRWLAADIESFLRSQSNVSSPIVLTSIAQKRRDDKSHAIRQAEAAATLRKHAANRNKQLNTQPKERRTS